MKSPDTFGFETLESRQFLSAAAIEAAVATVPVLSPAPQVQNLNKSAPRWAGSIIGKEGAVAGVELAIRTSCIDDTVEGVLTIYRGKSEPVVFLVNGVLSADKQTVQLSFEETKVVFGSLCGSYDPTTRTITADLCTNDRGVVTEEPVVLEAVQTKPSIAGTISFAPIASPLLGEWKGDVVGKDGAVGTVFLDVHEIDPDGVFWGEIGLVMFPKDQMVTFPFEGQVCSGKGDFVISFGEKACFGSLCGTVDPTEQKLDVTFELTDGGVTSSYVMSVDKLFPEKPVENWFSVEGPIELI